MAQNALLWDYTNKTLQGNWYEDRLQEPESVSFQQFLATGRGAPTSRTIPVHDSKLVHSTTTKSLHAGEQPTKVPPALKPMVGKNNFYEIHKERVPGATEGFNSIIPKHPPTESKTYFDTTYKAMYETEPAAAKETQSWPEQGSDERFLGGYPGNANPAKHTEPVFSDSRTFFRKGQLEKDRYDTEKREEGPRGSYGNRGHLTRVPEESGSKRGDATYADEYALK